MKFIKFIFSIGAISLMSLAVKAAVPSAGFSVVPATTSDVTPTLSKKQQELSFMKWFVTLNPKEYGQMRGKKLNIFEKGSFKLTQYRMKQQLKHYGSKGDSEGANWGGLALGFFLGLIGVLGAYIFSSDKNFIKWTWIGCGISLVFTLLLYLVIF